MKINKINIKGIRTEDFIENSANEIKNIIGNYLKNLKPYQLHFLEVTLHFQFITD